MTDLYFISIFDIGNLGGAPTSVAKDAVDYADALVEELKKGGEDERD